MFFICLFVVVVVVIYLFVLLLFIVLVAAIVCMFPAGADKASSFIVIFVQTYIFIQLCVIK